MAEILGAGNFGKVIASGPGKVRKIFEDWFECIHEFDVIRRLELIVEKGDKVPHALRKFMVEKDLPLPPIIFFTTIHIDPREETYIEMPRMSPVHFRSLPRSEWRNMGFDLLMALEYMHNKGVVHNDVKDTNTLFNPISGSYVLTDFSISASIVEEPVYKVYESDDDIEDLKGNLFTATDYITLQETQRRSDLESLLYTLIDVAGHHLPWSKLTGLDVLRERRKYIPIGPEGFKFTPWYEEPWDPKLALFASQVFLLGFHDIPDYKLLRSVLTN